MKAVNAVLGSTDEFQPFAFNPDYTPESIPIRTLQEFITQLDGVIEQETPSSIQVAFEWKQAKFEIDKRSFYSISTDTSESEPDLSRAQSTNSQQQSPPENESPQVGTNDEQAEAESPMVELMEENKLDLEQARGSVSCKVDKPDKVVDYKPPQEFKLNVEGLTNLDDLDDDDFEEFEGYMGQKSAPILDDQEISQDQPVKERPVSEAIVESKEESKEDQMTNISQPSFQRGHSLRIPEQKTYR